MENHVSLFTEALLDVDKSRCLKFLQGINAEGQNLKKIEEIISESLKIIGDCWEKGTVSLAQVYMSGVICEELFESYTSVDIDALDVKQRVAIAVLLDHHVLGKRIVLTTLKANGYHIMDFGCGLDVDELAELVKKHDIQLLMISTLMLHAALKVKELKTKLIENGYKTKIVVGGAPFRFDSELWQRVGADGF